MVRVTKVSLYSCLVLMIFPEISLWTLLIAQQAAFLRLQEEILKQSDDESILAWISETKELHGLLADSPYAFRQSGKMLYSSNNQRLWHSVSDPDRAKYIPWSMSNKGFYLTLPLTLPIFHIAGHTIAVLDCPVPGHTGYFGLRLKQIGRDQYLRTDCNKILSMQCTGIRERVCVPQASISSGYEHLSIRFSVTCTGKYRATRALFRGQDRSIDWDASNQWSYAVLHASRSDADFRELHQRRQQILAAFSLEDQSNRRKPAIVLLVSLGRWMSDTIHVVVWFDVREQPASSPLESLKHYQSTYRPESMGPRSCRNAGPYGIYPTWSSIGRRGQGGLDLDLKVSIRKRPHETEPRQTRSSARSRVGSV